MSSKNISFDTIPSSIRKPGKYFEYNTRLAVRTLPNNLQKMLIVAQRLTAGTVAALVSQTTPLHITGYTCSLGNRQENQILSLHRAKEVASELRAHGYTVKEEDIKGRGEEIPLTTDKQNFAINRRVEITE